MLCSGKISGVESQGGLFILFCLKRAASVSLSHFIYKMRINTLKEYKESCTMKYTYNLFKLYVYLQFVKYVKYLLVTLK